MNAQFQTRRLILKIITPEYYKEVCSFYKRNKSHFEQWEPKRALNFYSSSYQKTNLSIEYQQLLQKKFIRYWIFEKQNPHQIIGSVCFQNILKGPYHNCSIGYKLDYDYLHKGYAYEAVSACIDHIFSTYNLHRIEAYIHPENKSSIALIEKLQFRSEGTAYSYARLTDYWEDYLQYSLINPKHEKRH